MARVLISKATLADFGVPRQEVAVREPTDYVDLTDEEIQNLMAGFTGATYLDQFGVPLPSKEVQQATRLRAKPMPTAEEIEQVIRQSDIALTPREFVNKVPLIDRLQEGSDERFGDAGMEFGNKMGIEGSIAHGLAARDFPQIKEFEDPLAVPFIRDYYSRQSTLPEHFWDYHTEGPYYDEEGNILPGQVPPVNAVKVMATGDIKAMGGREGYGLKPVPFSRVNMDWDRTMGENVRFPSKNIGFVGGLTGEDIRRNTAGNVSAGTNKGVVGVRGFGRPQDKAFARGAITEGAEGGFTAPIPPERLVGVMPRTRMPHRELLNGALKHLYDKESTWDEQLHQLVEEGQISPIDAMYATIRYRAKQMDDPDLRDGSIWGDIYPPLESLTGTDAGGRNTTYSRAGWRGVTPAQEAIMTVRDNWNHALPTSWKEGKFGFENPLLTEKEKEAYIRDLQDAYEKTAFSWDLKERPKIEPSESRTLYPSKHGVRFR